MEIIAIEYAYLDKILRFFEKERVNSLIHIEFNEVLSFIQIDEEEFYFEPFRIELFSKDLYDYFFKEDINGITKIWILLKGTISFLDKKILININSINEKIIIETNDGGFKKYLILLNK